MKILLHSVDRLPLHFVLTTHARAFALVIDFCRHNGSGIMVVAPRVKIAYDHVAKSGIHCSTAVPVLVLQHLYECMTSTYTFIIID